MTVTHAPAQRASVTSKALRALILAYQAATGGRSPACRFVPSCSDYALEAVGRFGARKGIPLVARRLARCRPGGPFGLDPVPDGPSSDGACSDGTGSEGPDADYADQAGPGQDGANQNGAGPASFYAGVFVPDHPSSEGTAIDHLVAPAGSGAEKRTA